MRKTVILVLVFLLLAGAAYFLIQNSSEKGTLNPTYTKLYVEDVDKIHRVFIADRSGNTILLERQEKGDFWTLNDKYVARPWTMKIFLQTLRDMRIKYRPTNAAVEKIIPHIASDGIKVELYDEDNEKFKVFYVGPVTNDERGTYMMLEDSELPVVMHIPSWEGGLRARFFLDELDWRDKALFREEPSAIQEVSVQYPKQRSKSFSLTRNNGAFTVEPFYEITPEEAGEPHEGKVEAYLQGFEELYAEAFENKNPKQDSIIQTIPFSKLKLTRSDGSEKEVHFYPVVNPQLEKENVDYHIDRYYAKVQGGDFYLVQYQLVKRLFWPYDFFFESY